MTDDLLAAARGVQARAYAPYSHFPVGAAVETAGGAVFTGCNVENASYGLTVCAERNAVAAAVAAGHQRIVRCVVVSNSEPPASPCGACRQVLAEFGPDMEIRSVGPRSEARWTLGELLPSAFRSSQLGPRGSA